MTNLADNLSAAWHAPNVTMRAARQQLLRTLIADIIVDVDDDAREVVLTIHWRGGQHSELRVRKPRAGEHGCATTEDAVAVMRSMAGRWSDEHIAASLNRMGMPTGQGKTWTAHRVASVRRVRGIHAYRSAERDGECLTSSAHCAGMRGSWLRGPMPSSQALSDRCRRLQSGRPDASPLDCGTPRERAEAARNAFLFVFQMDNPTIVIVADMVLAITATRRPRPYPGARNSRQSVQCARIYRALRARGAK